MTQKSAWISVRAFITLGNDCRILIRSEGKNGINMTDGPTGEHTLFYSMPLEGQAVHKNMYKMWIKCGFLKNNYLLYIIICMYIVCTVQERKEHMKNTCRVY